MNSLQQLTDAWGNWSAQTHGTSCLFTASTDYSSQSQLSQYGSHQCSVSPQAANYNTSTPPTPVYDEKFDQWYTNTSTVVQSDSFDYKFTSQQEFEWSLSESLDLGVTVTVNEGVPDTVSASVGFSVSVTLSSSQSTTQTVTQSWSSTIPVQVPPKSKIHTEAVLQSESYDIPFTQATIVQGQVAIWYNDQVHGHWLHFIPIEHVFNDIVNNNLIDTTGYALNANGSGITATATGTFTGSQGIHVNVKQLEFKLDGQPEAAATTV